MNCEWVRENVALYLYNELGDDGRHEVEQHVNRCEACAEELETMKAFHVTMTALPKLEVTPNLLTASRMELQEALETTSQARGWARFALDPMAWLRQARFSPALAAVLLMVGFGGGVGATYKMARPTPGAQQVEQHDTSQAAISGVSNVVMEPGTNKVSIE